VRLVVAVGGNALLERGEVPVAEIQENHVEAAVASLASLVREHQIVVTHGNGPQVGLLANESAADPALPHPYPLDVLGAQTQGMIGYFFLKAFENALPGRQIVSLIGQTEVASNDPAFEHPTKFVGPQYGEDDGRRVAALRGWQIRLDGTSWRRVVASPEPLAVVELLTIRALVGSGAIVICAGGGGIPVVRGDDGLFRGAEAVVDKDLTASLLARDLGADALLILTDVANVELGFGTSSARPIGRTTPEALRAELFPAGSMGPKVDAACRFVEATGKRAMIGSLDEAGELLGGTRGTIIEPSGPSGSRSAQRSGVGSRRRGNSAVPAHHTPVLVVSACGASSTSSGLRRSPSDPTR
jgi:carbamate kinase